MRGSGTILGSDPAAGSRIAEENRIVTSTQRKRILRGPLALAGDQQPTSASFAWEIAVMGYSPKQLDPFNQHGRHPRRSFSSATGSPRRRGDFEVGVRQPKRLIFHLKYGRQLRMVDRKRVSGFAEGGTKEGFRMHKAGQRSRLRLTCPPCGEVFMADTEETLVAMAVEHAQKFHDINLLEQYRPDEFHALIRRENDSYWAKIVNLIPDGQVKTILDERLCDREREIVSYVVHGFPNREIADRLCISERTVSTHLVNVYEKLNVHSRAELTALVRATDRIIEAALRGDDAKQEFGPFVYRNGPKSR